MNFDIAERAIASTLDSDVDLSASTAYRLRKLKYSLKGWLEMQGRAAMYTTNRGCGVDPRSLAQRIMEVCTGLAYSKREVCV